MTRVLPLLALALALGTAFTFGPPAASPDDEAAVRAAALRWAAAWNAHDGETHAALYADGAVLVWPDGNNTVVDDRAAFVQGAAAYHAYAASARMDLTPAHVRFLGADAALITLTGTATFDAEAYAVNVMLVLERARGDWRIAGEHTLAVRGA